MQRTLVIVKPDGVQRSLVGEIVRRYERTGLKLVAMKMLVPTEDMVERHYLVNPNWLKNVGEKSIIAYEKKGIPVPFENPEDCGRAVLNRLKKYFTAGPVVAMVWQGNEAVGLVRKITGATEPLSSDVGTIRGDFTLDSYGLADGDDRAVRNLVHASGDAEEAAGEMKIWFKEEELMDYSLIAERVLYDVNLDGILE